MYANYEQGKKYRTTHEKKVEFEKNKPNLVDCHNCMFSLSCFKTVPEFGKYFTCDGFQFIEVS